MQPNTSGFNYPSNDGTSFAETVGNNKNILSGMNSTPQTQPQPSQDSGNWFTHLLPTIGSIAAPIIGGLLAPETGGLSLLAGAALSGAGGAGGKVAENTIEGKNPLDQNVLTEGVTNAIGGGVGGLIGKAGAKFVANVAAPGLAKAGTSLVAGQGGGALSKEDAQYLFNNGVTNLGDMSDIAPIVTGQTGALSNAVVNSLHNAADAGTRINLTSLGTMGKNLPGDTILNGVRDAGIAGDSNAVNSVQGFVQGQLEKFNQGAISNIPAKGGSQLTSIDNATLSAQHPVDALSMTQAMDSQASKWLSSSSPTIQAQGQALRNISNTVKDGLYGPETSIGQSGVTDQVKQQAIADLEPLKAINPQYYQTKVNEVTNANTIADLRTAQAPDVRASIANNSAQHADNMSGGTTVPEAIKVGAPVMGMGMGGPVGAIAGMAIPKVLGSNAVQTGATSVLSKLSKVAGSNTAQNMIPLLSRVGASTAVNLPTMGAGSTSPTNQPVLGGTMDNIQQPGQMTGQPQNQTPYDKLVQAMIAQSVLAPTMAGGSGASSFLSSIAPKLQAKQSLEAALPNLQTSFNNAGGAQGLGGIGSMLSSFVPGTAANAYQSQQEAAAAILATNLGISKDEAKSLLPQLMQNSDTANNRMSGLNSILGGLAG